MLSCAEELDQLSGLLRSNLSVPRMLVKYYHEMKRVYSRLIKQYAEHGMLKEKISRFFLRIRFDEIAFLLTYIEVCAPYEAFCLKEQGVTYLQFPEDPVSPTRKLIRKLGKDGTNGCKKLCLARVGERERILRNTLLLCKRAVPLHHGWD